MPCCGGPRNFIRRPASDSSTNHPMHLHSHHGPMLHRDVAVTGSPWSVDLLNVADGESYGIALLADSPGFGWTTATTCRTRPRSYVVEAAPWCSEVVHHRRSGEPSHRLIATATVASDFGRGRPAEAFAGSDYINAARSRFGNRGRRHQRSRLQTSQGGSGFAP
jgi:hypothetical protein